MIHRLSIVLACVVLSAAAGGCNGNDDVTVVIHDGPGRTQSSDEAIAEIDAASKRSFDDDRTDALERIARRHGLPCRAQVYLVDTALNKLSFENSKRSVLITLIDNRSFCRAAKARILDRIEDLGFQHDQVAVLDAIDRRGSLDR